MWKIARVDRYVGGKLPVPVAQDEQTEDQLLFLPNNKKDQYPDFLGYLKYTKKGCTTVQYAITKDGKGGVFMKQRPPVQDLDAAVQLLIDTAKAEGYVFA